MAVAFAPLPAEVVPMARLTRRQFGSAVTDDLLAITDVNHSIWGSIGVGLQIVDDTCSKLRIVTQESDCHIAWGAEQPPNCICFVVMIDAEVPLLRAARVGRAADGALPMLLLQKRVVLGHRQAVGATECGSSIGQMSGLAILLRPFAARRARAFEACRTEIPILPVALSTSPSEVLCGLDDLAVSALLEVTSGRLPRRWILVQVVLVGPDTVLALRDKSVTNLLVVMEGLVWLPFLTYSADLSAEEWQLIHGEPQMNRVMNYTRSRHRCASERRFGMASKRHQRRRTCQSKQRHASAAAAWAHAFHLRHKTGSQGYVAYHCAWGHWHAGRQSRRDLARREAVA